MCNLRSKRTINFTYIWYGPSCTIINLFALRSLSHVSLMPLSSFISQYTNKIYGAAEGWEESQQWSALPWCEKAAVGGGMGRILQIHAVIVASDLGHSKRERRPLEHTMPPSTASVARGIKLISLLWKPWWFTQIAHCVNC